MWYLGLRSFRSTGARGKLLNAEFQFRDLLSQARNAIGGIAVRRERSHPVDG
jgi:hypothetical protein